MVNRTVPRLAHNAHRTIDVLVVLRLGAPRVRRGLFRLLGFAPTRSTAVGAEAVDIHELIARHLLSAHQTLWLAMNITKGLILHGVQQALRAGLREALAAAHVLIKNFVFVFRRLGGLAGHLPPAIAAHDFLGFGSALVAGAVWGITVRRAGGARIAATDGDGGGQMLVKYWMGSTSGSGSG